MKTILIAWVRPINMQRGGIHRIVNALMEQLPKRGYKCLYLIYKMDMQTFYVNGEEKEENKLNRVELKEYIVNNHVDIIVDHHSVFTSEFAKMVKSFKLQAKYVSVYHNSVFLFESIFNWAYYSNVFCQSPSWKMKLGALLRLSVYPLWRVWSKRNIDRLYQENYNCSDKTVLLSKYEIPYVLARINGADKSRILSIPNLLSFPTIENEDILSHKKKEVLVISRIYNNEKRIDKVLDIWKIIQERGFTDWQLKIVGAGKDEEALKQYARELNLKNYSFEGRQVAYPYYLSASIFMMTSRIEGWGLTLTESMQTGVVPMVWDSYPALKEIITDGYDGCIIPNNDVDEYANRLEWLMTHASERQQIAKNGLISAKRFEIDKIIDLWVNLIESL